MSEEENIKYILKSKRININSDGLYSDEKEIDNSLSGLLLLSLLLLLLYCVLKNITIIIIITSE